MKAHNSWKPFIENELNKDYYKNLTLFLKEELLAGKSIYPNKNDWFNSLSIPMDSVKVVILGQDPYHGENQAHGFSFSVPNGVKQPPSLKNIFIEIENEFNITMSKKNGNLTPWVEQGVLLLNSVLTVEKSLAASHKNKGWEIFTDKIIEIISQNLEGVVFVLWGNYAIKKSNLIDVNKHLLLKSPHPSPFSVHTGFWGNNHFIKANQYLISKGKQPINWLIEDNLN